MGSCSSVVASPTWSFDARMCLSFIRNAIRTIEGMLRCQTTLCTESNEMQISEAVGGTPTPGAEPCRFPKLEECAHFHYERVQLPQLLVALQTNMDQSLHSQHGVICEEEVVDWQMVQVTSGDECWLLQRSWENFKMLDEQLHQCIFDRKVSKLPDLRDFNGDPDDLQDVLTSYLSRFSSIADNSLNCGPILNWFQMDNRGHRLLVPSEESRSINTPAVAAAYSVRRYVSQARDELNLEVGDMISVIDMASPGESVWWRGKRGFQVGFFPQHCVHIIGDKVPRNIPLPPPIVGSLALSPIKPVLRKHGKLIAFFRSFILNRPSRRKLKQSGILKERVFGCDLGEHLLNSGHDIPMVLKCCAEFIEEHGIVDGIYRLSGITSNIQKLRNAFDEDRIPNLYTEDILQDIHSVASLLKMYFRELPNPLCTYQLYQSFVGAVQGCNSANRDVESDRDRLLKMREAVQKLPPPHYRTLEYLMRHLAKVAAFGARTGMTTRNVAIVWAPNLLRCAELEVGGVAALQGVGIQAVVTEFLICYADLIFCDRLPASLDLPQQQQQVLGRTASFPSPKRCRPKSLAISTPTKLITLEEARNKHMSGRLGAADECGYIEVGGGPQNLPKKYHTVIELPSGNRKRGLAKRSPLGWRSFFSKNRSNAQAKSRKASTPGIVASDKFVTESDLTDIKRKLRTVKSAESLTSGHSEPAANDSDVLGPLNPTNKPSGHNRSVSHDSYFDTLQTSQNNSEGSLLDLSEIQLNFELEESEMRIFSEDESLVSSPRRVLTRMRPEGGSMNPSPKKQARMLVSPESNSRKRTRLEDQLSDIQFIDCCTPENVVTTTTVVVHQLPEVMKTPSPTYRKSKSPRNSGGDCCESPGYQRLGDSSAGTTSPGFSPEYGNPVEIEYRKLDDKVINSSPAYENVLTTISITYKSPTKSSGESIYEDLNPEKAMIPTVPAELPEQEAMQPEIITFVKDASARSSSSSTPPSPTSPLSSLHLSLSEVVAGDSSCNEPATSVGTPITLSPNVTTPSTPDLVEFASEGEKRKSSEIAGDVVVDGDDEREVYQQVKYFRRSVGEVNALLEEEVCKADEEETCSGDFDSLEVIDANVAVYENVILVDKADEKETAVDVDSLEVVVVENGTHEPTTVDEEAFHPRKVYDKESLPPCLRARNMRNQLKTTRSLDESEFTSVGGGESSLTTERRKSMDEGRLKTLNAPKPVPFGVDEVKSVHMAHQSEVSVSEQQRRERIERYKEERRKFLQDKYKSESFKEDKDVLLSRLKVFKMRDETEVEEEEGKTRIPRPTARRKNNDVGSSPPPPLVEVANSIRSRTAMFEMRARKGEDEEEQQQQHVVLRRGERGNRVYNRHTLETGGRERMSSSPPPAERRASLDSCKRRDPVTPTYCIKDMKAIFESKSKQ